MATRDDLNDDLSIGMSQIGVTLEHYNLSAWNAYLVVRQPGKAESYIILKHPSDQSDFGDRLLALHNECVRREL